MSDFPGLGHVALTVRSVDASKPWYEKLLGAAPALDEDTGPWRHIVWALPGGTLLGIHEHPADLEKWQGKLDELGIAHGGISDARKVHRLVS